MHGLNAPPASRQLVVAPGSALKVKAGAGSRVVPLGPPSIATTGATTSTVQPRVTTGLTFDATSIAQPKL